MAIQPKCSACGEELDEPGAILIGPPEGEIARKSHLCTVCYDEVETWINDKFIAALFAAKGIEVK